MKKSHKIIMIVAIIIASLILLAFLSAIVGLNRMGRNELPLPGFDTLVAPSVGTGYGIMTQDAEMKRSMIAEEMPSAVPVYEEGYLSDDEFANIDQRIIKNGNITAKVDNAEDSATKISEIAGRYEGFVQSSNIFESSTGAKSGTIIIRVPVDKFELAFNEIKTLATQVVSESVSGQDVTEQYIDLQSRLKNKKAEEEQYLEILNRASDIEDILMVTERLSYVRGEIERLQGRLNYLENQTDLSTITTFVSEEEKIEIPVAKWRPIETIRTAFRAMIAGLQGLANLAIWLIMFAALIVLPIGLIIWLIVWIVKKFHHKKK